MGKMIAKSKPPLTVNPARREQLVDEHGLEPETLFMDGHDSAILGVASRFGMYVVVAYDYQQVIANLVDGGMPLEEAQTWFDYNMIGAWLGDYTPLFVNRLG